MFSHWLVSALGLAGLIVVLDYEFNALPKNAKQPYDVRFDEGSMTVTTPKGLELHLSSKQGSFKNDRLLFQGNVLRHNKPSATTSFFAGEIGFRNDIFFFDENVSLRSRDVSLEAFSMSYNLYMAIAKTSDGVLHIGDNRIIGDQIEWHSQERQFVAENARLSLRVR